MSDPTRAVARRLLPALLAVVVLVAAAVPNDPLVSQQPHLNTVRAFEAWDVRRGEGAVVAVLDTGVDLDHPDLMGRLVPGIDLVDGDDDPDDPQGHGTIVAGIIAANADNGRGVAGVAPQAQVMPIRVLDRQGRGSSSTVAEGIRFAIERSVQVINLSLAEVEVEGVLGLSLVADMDVRTAIDDATAAGILVVAAAGNSGNLSTPYAADSPVLIVGATTGTTTDVWENSNRDDRTIFAPGVDILSTWQQGRYARADGTSFATPIVAAGAAMLLGAGVDLDTARQMLIDSATDIGVGLGRVDLAAAVQGLPTAPPPPQTDAEPPPPQTDAEPPPPQTDAEPPPPDPPVQTTPPATESVEAEDLLEPAVPVEEVAGPAPTIPDVEPSTTVSEPPPPISTGQSGTTPTASEDGAVPSDDGPVPSDQDPTGAPSPSDQPTRRPLVVDDQGGLADSRTLIMGVAGVLIGGDVLLAGWVLRRNND